MLQKLFSSKLRVDLLSLFFGRPDEEFYVREIEKILQEDVGNISRELKNLEGIGLLVSKRREFGILISWTGNFPFTTSSVPSY